MRNKIRWLWKYYRGHLYVLVVLLALTPVQTMFQVMLPQFFGFTIDYVDSGKVPDHFLARLITDTGAGIGLTPIPSIGCTHLSRATGHG
jgi:ABC-type multidrug transport system fused ATPase/permease subunit